MNSIFINTDGGSRGNPGPAAVGIVFTDDKKSMIFSYKKTIGVATNNEAEYQAIIKALEILLESKWFKENNIAEKKVICRLDSKLVVEQINGNYKIKQDHLKLLIAKIQRLISQMHLNISFVHIPREENKIADKLVNEALDGEN
ncbi:MAG: ribonuclease HI family protein [Candidatus Berkelbacteria bacterium]|nr:ribonuclease HI family protein [Candidatus Berkelbacteria bacterium]